MKYKNFFRLCVNVVSISLLTVCFAISTPSEAAKTFKFAHADTETAIFHKGALAFKEKLEQLSNGELKVQIFPSGQMGTLADAVQGIQMGTIDFTPITSATLANFAPDIAVYDMPFLIENYQHAYDSLDGDVGKHLNDELAKNGILCKGWWALGFRNITCKRDIKTIDDLKGLKLRVQNSKIHIALFKALNVNAAPIGWSELFTALQQGTVDGQENPYTQILQANIYEVNNMLVESEHAYQPAGFLMAPATYANLNNQEKAWVDEAAAYATEVERKACEADNASALEELTKERGMKFVKLDKAELQKRATVVYDQFPEFKELVEQIRAYKK